MHIDVVLLDWALRRGVLVVVGVTLGVVVFLRLALFSHALLSQEGAGISKLLLELFDLSQSLLKDDDLNSFALLSCSNFFENEGALLLFVG